MNHLKIVSEKPTMKKHLMCSYCGAITISSGGTEFCSNCELTVKDTKTKLISLNHTLITSLDTINGFYKNNKFSDADDLYLNILKDTDDPLFLYTYAIFLIKYSNFKLSKVSYDKEGFMEDNANYRTASWKIYGNARMFLYNCIERIEKNQEIHPLQKRFAVFLSMMKLGNIRSASIELEKIKGIENGQTYNYAKIILDSAIKNYDQIIIGSENFLSNTPYPQNVIYYLAFALFKNGKIRESIKLSQFMNKNYPNLKYIELIKTIEKTTALD